MQALFSETSKRIPEFPQFKPLEVQDKPLIDSIVNDFLPYSDFNFISLWSYNVDGTIIISQLHNNLIVRFEDYIDKKNFYSFIGRNNVEHTINVLLEYSKQQDLVPVLKLVPHDSINEILFSNHNFKIVADRDNFDYILSINDIINLDGLENDSKLRLVKKFWREHPHIHIQKIDASDKFFQEQLIYLFFKWKDSKNKEDSEILHELYAFKRLLSHAKYFNLLTIGVYDKNELIGFKVNELLPNDYVIGHFGKGNMNYRGITEIIFNESAKLTRDLGYKYINIEQDLGIQGLRVAKQLWRPITMLRKYTISA